MAKRFSVEAVIKAVDKVSAPVTKMRNRVSKFTRSAVAGMKKLSRSMDKVVSTMGQIGKRGAVAIGATGTAAGLLVDRLTKADVRAQQLAASVQFPVRDLTAITGAVAGAGFEMDNVIDLIEEMNNKLGESAGLEPITPVHESLHILGLRFKDIAKLRPEEQFKKIVNAALAMEDAQKAAAAADILLGGEANKVIGVLRQQGGTIDEIIGKYDALNFRTKESLEGSQDFQEQMRLTSMAVKTVSTEVVGLIARSLAPLMEQLVNWMSANRELIASSITSFVQNLTNGIIWLVENFSDVVKWVKRIGTAFLVFTTVNMVLKTIVGTFTALNLIMAANPIGLIVAGIAVLAATTVLIMENWDRIVETVGNVAGKIAEFFGFGTDEDGSSAGTGSPGGQHQEAQGGRTVSTYIQRSEVTIKDDTGRAEATKGEFGRNGVSLYASGAF